MSDDDRSSRLRHCPCKFFSIPPVITKAVFLAAWNHAGSVSFASGMHRHHHGVIVSFRIADFRQCGILVAQIRNAAKAGKPKKSDAHSSNLQHGNFMVDSAGCFDPCLGKRRIGGGHAALPHIPGMIIGYRDNFNADIRQ